MGQRWRLRTRGWSLGLLLLTGACTTPVGVIGLRPLFPPAKPWYWVDVGSLQPTFDWESFPRPQDLAGDKAPPGHVTDVTYDLRIWRAGDFPDVHGVGMLPTELVYAKRALPEASHRVEQPLTPGTWYYWTVRARFALDGEPRVTEWGRYHEQVLSSWQEDLRKRVDDMLPSPLYFRFRTPAP